MVVPRPIGWVSTFDVEGLANLAPYSFFNAFSASPMYVGISVGRRGGGPKDTLRNVRERGAFCVNVVSEHLLESMNETSAEVESGVDEFDLAGLAAAVSPRVDAPFVDGCPAVLECEAHREISLDESANTLMIGRVVGIRLGPELSLHDGTMRVDFASLRAVGRLSGGEYLLPRTVEVLARPEAPYSPQRRRMPSG